MEIYGIEEKKAIEMLKEARDDNINGYDLFYGYEKIQIDIILNLIEKQQKELEQEKEKNKTLKDIEQQICNEVLIDTSSKAFAEKYILKDKIRAKIEEIKNTCYYNEGDATAVEQVFILEKLLEE